MSRIISGNYVYFMDKDEKPAASVAAGETVTFETVDCFGGQMTEEGTQIGALDWDRINPATGPVYVEGAEPGDILKVEIQRIETGELGIMAALPGEGVLGDGVLNPEVCRMPVKDGYVEFSEKIRLPKKPMIGVIGVAPAGEKVPCGTPGSHGGNMDNTRIGEGAVLYLPVFQKGALFALGDVHACMGDGEIMVSGVEISASVTVKIDVMKGKTLHNPALEDESAFYAIASEQNLEEAVKLSVSDMHEIVQNKLGLDYNKAGMLLSAAGDVQICQVVDPERTARFRMPKTILPELF